MRSKIKKDEVNSQIGLQMCTFEDIINYAKKYSMKLRII